MTKASGREDQFARVWELFASDLGDVLDGGEQRGPVREYAFHDTRRWRFDFAWPSVRVAVEIEGGTFSRKPGRHGRAIGHYRDCEKYNAATLAGWRVLRFTSKDLDERPIQAVEQVCELIRFAHDANYDAERN